MESHTRPQPSGLTRQLLVAFVGAHVVSTALLGAVLLRHANLALPGAALAVVGLMAGVALLLVATRRARRQADSLSEMAAHYQQGKYGYRAEVLAEDGLGRVAHAFNAALDENRALRQAQAERDRLRVMMRDLLAKVADLVEDGQAAEQMQGMASGEAMAEVLGRMTASLRGMMGRVQEVSREVNATAGETLKQTESLVTQTEAQARQLAETRGAVEQMTRAMLQVSEEANLSATVAEQSLKSARDGAGAVQDTIRGMQRVREQVQDTAKRIRRLEESSGEIGEIVQLIEEIADRTGILAVNASIQAEAAGKAGRGFAVVAGEVEQLAERAADATRRIAGLVKTIQMGTAEAIVAMEDSTREAARGATLANQAGQALTEIEAVSQRLADLNQGISQATRQQAAGSQALEQAMTGLSDASRGAASDIRRSADSVTSLADQLRAAVYGQRLSFEE